MYSQSDIFETDVDGNVKQYIDSNYKKDLNLQGLNHAIMPDKTKAFTLPYILNKG
jgi:hypothetical protein